MKSIRYIVITHLFLNTFMIQSMNDKQTSASFFKEQRAKAKEQSKAMRDAQRAVFRITSEQSAHASHSKFLELMGIPHANKNAHPSPVPQEQTATIIPAPQPQTAHITDIDSKKSSPDDDLDRMTALLQTQCLDDDEPQQNEGAITVVVPSSWDDNYDDFGAKIEDPLKK